MHYHNQAVAAIFFLEAKEPTLKSNFRSTVKVGFNYRFNLGGQGVAQY